MKNQWIIKHGKRYMMLDTNTFNRLYHKHYREGVNVLGEKKVKRINSHVFVDELSEATTSTSKIMLEEYCKSAGEGHVVSYLREKERLGK